MTGPSQEKERAVVGPRRATDRRWPVAAAGLAAVTFAVTLGLSAVAAPRGDERPEADPAVVLEGPSLDAWEPVLGPVEAPDRLPGADGAALTALVRAYEVPVFDRPGPRGRKTGRIRRGTFAPVERRQRAGSCRGRWYDIGRGWVCTAYGVEVAKRPSPLQQPQRRPAVWRPLPFQYGQVVADDAPRLSRLPTPKEAAALDRALATGRPLPDPVVQRMKGDYYVSIDETVAVDAHAFVRTVRGQYVRAEDVEPLPTPAMHGERLGGDVALPLAFVYGGDAPVYRLADGLPLPVGIARKHARFTPTGRIELGGTTLLETPGGALVPAGSVRQARAIPKPRGIPAGARWVHVDLAQQALVAYEGDRPVFATLVSSGREGYETPTGLYRVRRKFLTKTMRGADVVDGVYDVEDVPWTLFYHGGYAVHGAYWHDAFGEVKSHGCTNVAPADARWLYYWSTPRVPDGWHAVHEAGTWILFTDD